MEWLLGICTLLGGISAVWFFWDKISPIVFRRTAKESITPARDRERKKHRSEDTNAQDQDDNKHFQPGKFNKEQITDGTVRPLHPSLAELLGRYSNYLQANVGKVRILGEADERELRDVFVELSIVDRHGPRQHAEFLSMVDSSVRRRFNQPANTGSYVSPDLLEQPEGKAKRRLKPDELLPRRAKAIIAGAPGCGKTTLLKYLALQAHEREKWLVVWLELKAIEKPLLIQAEEEAARDGNLMLKELWLRHLKIQLSLSDAEVRLLSEYWQEKLRANEIVVLLDGFDEIHDEALERGLNKCVREFASAPQSGPLFISTRPYAQQRLGNERMQELEIEPLDQGQVEAFLNCYYPDDAAAKSLLTILRERSSLRELLRVPLLLGVILRLHRENRFTDDRLKLYESIVSDLIIELDRSKSITRQFNIRDERLRSDFLKFLAFERLLRDPLGEGEHEASRIVFSYALLKEKARIFLAQERSSHDPRELADDTLATPLLRAVGADAFAFTHLTLQEYLAARGFAEFQKGNEIERLRVFCRAYHNPIIVELEALPMVLGAAANADKLYGEIKRFPDSLDFIGLRLRLRGLSYGSQISHETLVDLMGELAELLVEKRVADATYCDLVANSLQGMSGPAEDYVIARLSSLLSDRTNTARWRAARALGLMRSPSVLQPLANSLDDPFEFVRATAAEALGLLRNQQSVPSLLNSLRDAVPFVRACAAKALGNIKSKDTVEPLIQALATEVDDYARGVMADALGEIGDERAVEVLSLEARRNQEESWHASEALVKIGERGITEVLRNVVGDDNKIRWRAFTALPDNLPPSAFAALGDFKMEAQLLAGTPYSCLLEIGEHDAVEEVLTCGKKMLLGQMTEHEATTKLRESHAVVPGVLKALRNRDSRVRANAAEVLGITEDPRAIEPLIQALRDEDSAVREKAAGALGGIKSPLACDALAALLDDEDENIREQAAGAVGTICRDKADNVVVKLDALVGKEPNNLIRWNSITSLGQVGGEKAAFILLTVLLFNRMSVDKEKAVEALSSAKHSDLGGALRVALYANNAPLKAKAAQIVGYYTAEEEVLIKLSALAQTDADGTVREAAKVAAEKLAYKLEFLGDLRPGGEGKTFEDNESREGVMVHEVGGIVFAAGHIFRPTPNNDWGIDGEIEFKNDKGDASGTRVYLQLKSGDSYLRTRTGDGKQVFSIKNPRHAEYWQAHAYPVLLVIRNSLGHIRWMNVTEYLRHHGINVTQIEFLGEPFTVESVRQMRGRFGSGNG